MARKVKLLCSRFEDDGSFKFIICTNPGFSAEEYCSDIWSSEPRMTIRAPTAEDLQVVSDEGHSYELDKQGFIKTIDGKTCNGAVAAFSLES